MIDYILLFKVWFKFYSGMWEENAIQTPIEELLVALTGHIIAEI